MYFLQDTKIDLNAYEQVYDFDITPCEYYNLNIVVGNIEEMKEN